MPTITVRVPEVKTDPLVKSLNRQFAALQKSLQRPGRASDQASLVRMLSKQQDALLRSMERLMGRHAASEDDDLAEAMRGIRKAMTRLPDALKSALETTMKRSRNRTFGSNY